jgi:hypothetical protein
MEKLDDIAWLSQWYLSQCDEEWEEQFGVSIGTLDNPGWELTVDLDGTRLEARSFAAVYEGVPHGEQLFQGGDGDAPWLVCRVEGSKFKAWGGPRDLGRMIGIFRAWVDAEGGI